MEQLLAGLKMHLKKAIKETKDAYKKLGKTLPKKPSEAAKWGKK